jgi:hypothetical protein
MLLIDGKLYEFQPLPTIFFGSQKPLAYVLNPKVASTVSHNFIFYVNHGYRYFDPYQLWHSPIGVLGLGGTEIRPDALALFLRFKPETYSIVRDPYRRFISAFLSKVFTDEDPAYLSFRDQLTSLQGIDLSPEADPAQSCLAFAKWLARQEMLHDIDSHFRPQYLNLGSDTRFSVDTILRIEDPEALHAFHAKWVGEEKAKWFLSLRFNQQTKFKPEECMSDELEAVVRQVFARDYELYYPNA